jgi:hypothetical protein
MSVRFEPESSIKTASLATCTQSNSGNILTMESVHNATSRWAYVATLSCTVAADEGGVLVGARAGPLPGFAGPPP